MAKKKRSDEAKDSWCFYCDRVFNDDKILIDHQKARHFKCERCNRKLMSANGMAIHVQQVHLVSCLTVPNALPGRDALHWNILGMEGVPEEALEEHLLNKKNKKVFGASRKQFSN